jgi:translocation and assembly module TamA
MRLSFITSPRTRSFLRPLLRGSAAAALPAGALVKALLAALLAGTGAVAAQTTIPPAPEAPPPATAGGAETPAAEADPADSPGTNAPPAFNIDIRAPAAVRNLLQRHLELRRYRAVTDLDDSELQRLLVQAERDARELLGTLGFFDPKIALTREPGAPGTPPLVVVEVEPGAPTTVTEVNLAFEGDIAQSSDEDAVAQRERIRSGWRLPQGQRFTQEGWDDAKAQAVRQLVARRYPAGRISYSLADIDAAGARAGLGLRLDSGPVFRLGEMVVTGLERYEARLVPRLARLRPGMVYDQDQIVQAQLRLAGSGYFDSAFIFIDPAGNPQAVPVQVNVREAPLHKIVLGLGLTTDSGPRASVEYLNNRVPGIGWRARTRLQLERKAPFAETEWTAMPDERGWRWGVLGRVERLDDGVLLTHGQQLRVGRSKTGDHIDRNVYLQYEHASVKVQEGKVAPADSDVGEGAALSANYIWTGRYFDRTPFPNSGYGVGFELGAGVTLTGERSPFQRTVVRWLGIRPLTQGRLQLRAEGGAVLARDAARLPNTQLFRTGGDTTVRGYGYRDIGVDRGNGVVGPGRFMAVGSVEWQRPISRNGVATPFESVLFADAGAVADRPGDLRPQVGVGAGVRWRSPIGPFQVDLAYGVKPKRLRVHLNIGVTF